MSDTDKTRPWKFRGERNGWKNNYIGDIREPEPERLNHRAERHAEKQVLHSLITDVDARDDLVLPERVVDWMVD